MSRAVKSAQRKAIRVLLVEDSEGDAWLAVRTLQQGGFEVQHERIQTAAAMQAALSRQAWDAVISDFRMPGFTGLEALKILRDSGLDIPFILTSGTIGEEAAVEIMKAGANDYVLKENLARLAPALERELREFAFRAEHNRAQAELSKLSLAVRQSGTAIVITDPAGAIEFVNPKFEAMTGYNAAEVIGRNPRLLKSGAQSQEYYRDLWETITSGREWHGELQNRKKTGELYWESQHISPVLDDRGAILHFIAVKDDITQRKQAETALHESERKYRRIYDSLQDAYVETALDGTVLEVSPQIETLTRGQYRREDFLGKPSSSFYADPGEREVLMGALASGRAVLDHELTFRNRDGSLLSASISAKIVRDEEGRPERIASMMRDISERKKSDDRIRRLNRVYAVLSGINALIVRVRSREELFREACRIAIEAGEFRIAWIGLLDRASMRVRPIAWEGPGREHVDRIDLTITEGSPGGGTLGALALREERVMISNDVEHDPRVVMRAEMVANGLRSIAVLPLLVSGQAQGVLTLVASDAAFFDNDEMKLLRELAGDISFAIEHIEKSEKVDYLAYYDPLTGLANRTLFQERLSQQLHAAQAGAHSVALLIGDVERFKSVNDSLGRQAGDLLLKQLAQRLRKDAPEPIEIARTGADQFAIALPHVKRENEVARFVEQCMRECFGAPFALGDANLRVRAKVGVALYPNDGADPETLFRNAESALDRAKATGTPYVFFAKEMTERVAGKLALENKLQQALDKDEFVLHYQPKVDLESRRIVGVEALIRWVSPERGLVPPGHFIPLLEETGLILEVGAWAIRRALRDHRHWLEQGIAAPRVAVNVSQIQLRQRNFVDVVREALQQGANPAGLDLEITETMVMRDIEGTIAKLKALRDLGLAIAIDDFGTGYSSLGYLAKLPLHSLKIDRSFIVSMASDPDAMTLVSTIISLAHSLRLDVVAEGVETEEQARMLRLLRCDQMQGYLFSKPLPLAEMTALLRQQGIRPQRVTA